MLLKRFLRRKRACFAVALPAVLIVALGSAWAQSQSQAPRPRPRDTKPTETRAAAPAKPADDAPIDAAQTSEAPPKPNDVSRSPSDPVVALVEGHMLYLSDLAQLVPSLPESVRSLPFETLYPALLDRSIDHQALVAVARREHLDDDPRVKREVDAATERILEAALLAREVAPQVGEEQIRLRYNKEYAGKPSTEETHARHILVATEEQAKQLIADLNKGADFATLARQFSKDPDGQNGGDLGYFRRDQVWPGFADVAFTLQPGQIAQKPIQNEFGWHVIKVDERRFVAPPGYGEIHDALRKELLQEAAARAVQRARSQLTIHKYNMDGTPVSTVPDIIPAQPLVKPDDSAKP
jgi:peptidyl-prolyl cis-trans isomerase C